MKVIFLVNSLDGPSTRYRVLQYLPYFKKEGWEAEVSVFPKGLRERKKLYSSLQRFDLVFLQKRLLSFFHLSLLRRQSKRLVFDFDDAILFRDSPKGEFNSRIRKGRFVRMIKNADEIIAGNDYLKQQAICFNPHVSIIPTPVDMGRYRPKRYISEGSTLTLGWIGSSSTLFYLERLKPVLDRLYRRYPHIHLKIVADRFFDSDCIPILKKRWREEEEIDDLHSFDIGLMPLTDDPWSRGKCGFKLLQCMAVGVPVVSSPVGVNREIVEHGVNGFLAAGDDQWIEQLSLLIENAHLRKKMGEEAIHKVRREYALEVWAPKLLEILDHLGNPSKQMKQGHAGKHLL